MLPMLMMLPAPCAHMYPAAYLMPSSGPQTFTSNARRKSARSTSVTELMVAGAPALFTSTSMRPNRSEVERTRSSTSVSTDTSAR